MRRGHSHVQGGSAYHSGHRALATSAGPSISLGPTSANQPPSRHCVPGARGAQPQPTRWRSEGTLLARAISTSSSSADLQIDPQHPPLPPQQHPPPTTATSWCSHTTYTVRHCTCSAAATCTGNTKCQQRHNHENGSMFAATLRAGHCRHTTGSAQAKENCAASNSKHSRRPPLYIYLEVYAHSCQVPVGAGASRTLTRGDKEACCKNGSAVFRYQVLQPHPAVIKGGLAAKALPWRGTQLARSFVRALLANVAWARFGDRTERTERTEEQTGQSDQSLFEVGGGGDGGGGAGRGLN